MRYWEGEPARPTTSPPPYEEHRTMAVVLAVERRRKQLRLAVDNNLRKKDADPLCPC